MRWWADNHDTAPTTAAAAAAATTTTTATTTAAVTDQGAIVPSLSSRNWNNAYGRSYACNRSFLT
ncbi:hypothetical protein XAR_4435 [Xanthomonas citri pv. glycines str. 8ra]|nr:hypothetical protein XAR_4435 [Xanthomonas citri pv. glycines str. 8ra]